MADELSELLLAFPENERDSLLIWIREAKGFLDTPNKLISVANAIGMPLEKIQKKIPEKAQALISKATNKALQTALNVAVLSTFPILNSSKKITHKSASPYKVNNALNRHTFATAVSGAFGGILGPVSMLAELPLTTTLILRSISNAAADCGFDPNDPEIKAECLFVFTLGSNKSAADDEMNSAYFTSKLLFSKALKSASAAVAAKESESVILSLITKVAARYQIAVSEKFLADAIPVLGILGNAALNASFADYFGRAAKYHFGMKALEVRFGKEKIEKIFSLC